MSNQVYSGPQQKYYALPGLNNYILGSNQIIAGGAAFGVGVSATAAFSTISLEQVSGLVSLAAGTFTVQEAGMYSVKANIGFIPFSGSKDPEVGGRLIIRRSYAPSVDVTVEIQKLRMPNTGGADNFQYAISLNFTGYLGVGDTFKAVLTNYDTDVADIITLLASSCDCVWTKIY